MSKEKPPTLRQLELMEIKGLALVGPTFRETLAYIQIQRMKKQLQSLEETADE